MASYLIKPRGCIFVNGYGFLSFTKSMGKIIDGRISKTLSSK